MSGAAVIKGSRNGVVGSPTAPSTPLSRMEGVHTPQRSSLTPISSSASSTAVALDMKVEGDDGYDYLHMVSRDEAIKVSKKYIQK